MKKKTKKNKINNIEGVNMLKCYNYLIFLIICFLSLSCETHGDLVEDLKMEIQKKSFIIVSDITKFSWDKMYVFPPYTPVDSVNATLGTVIKKGIKRIEDHDDTVLIVFQNRLKVIKHIYFSRNYGDFSKAFRKEGYSPMNSKFRKTIDDNDWIWLIPVASNNSIQRKTQLLTNDPDTNH